MKKKAVVVHRLGEEASHEDNVRADGPYYAGNACAISYSGTFEHYAENLAECLRKTQATGRRWDDVRKTKEALRDAREAFLKAHRDGCRVVFVGNGGSAAIASHMAVDYTKNGGIRSVALNDAPTLTCLANDFGYDQVFAKQLEFHGRKGDAVVIISSSGRSLNILAAVQAAHKKGCFIVTLSGMNPNNKLRRLGDLNFYVPCLEYGLVEVTHLSLLHAVVSVTTWK